MGQYLSWQLGPAYVAIGFTTGHGTASVFPDGSARTLVLAAPVAGFYEAWLDQATPPNYFLSLNRATVAGSKWLVKSQKLRNIGEREAFGGAEDQFMDYPPLPRAFDALFYLHETSASQPRRVASPPR